MEGLSLTEYSNKYHISISTLRRKIKSGKITFHLKSGKYFLADQSPEKQKTIKKELPSFAGEQALDSQSKPSQREHEAVRVNKEGIKGPPAGSLVVEKAPQKAGLADSEKKPFSASTFTEHKTLSEGALKDSALAFEEPKAKAFTSEQKDSDLLEQEEKAHLSGADLKPKEPDFASSQAVLSKLVDSQRELLKQVEKKDEIINLQKDKIADLNTLTAFLEKENRELKSLLHEEKQIEEWLEAPSP